MKCGAPRHKFPQKSLALPDKGADTGLLTPQRGAYGVDVRQQRTDLGSAVGDDARQAVQVVHRLRNDRGQPFELLAQSSYRGRDLVGVGLPECGGDIGQRVLQVVGHLGVCEVDDPTWQLPGGARTQLKVARAQDRGDLHDYPGVCAKPDIVAHPQPGFHMIAGQPHAGDLADGNAGDGHDVARM
ncbi:Uncharacterised protein [Mycobacteroides abscessus subsp. abscessus]|nr:Uncharacterised protein [Mycobacteroides abscessus subsp. abscessus]